MKYIARAILILLLSPVLIIVTLIGVLLALRQDKPNWNDAFDFPRWVITGK